MEAVRGIKIDEVVDEYQTKIKARLAMGVKETEGYKNYYKVCITSAYASYDAVTSGKPTKKQKKIEDVSTAIVTCAEPIVLPAVNLRNEVITRLKAENNNIKGRLDPLQESFDSMIKSMEANMKFLLNTFNLQPKTGIDPQMHEKLKESMKIKLVESFNPKTTKRSVEVGLDVPPEHAAKRHSIPAKPKSETAMDASDE